MQKFSKDCVAMAIVRVGKVGHYIFTQYIGTYYISSLNNKQPLHITFFPLKLHMSLCFSKSRGRPTSKVECKVIDSKYSKNWPYTVAHTIDCVCIKC